MQGAAVKRAVGFAPQFAYYAEVTEVTRKGLVTVREGGYTEGGALTRAKLAARDRLFFVGFRRAVGYINDALHADYGVGKKTTIGYA